MYVIVVSQNMKPIQPAQFFYRTSFSIILFLAGTLNLHAQWIPKNKGLTSNQVTALAVDGSNLFAGTSDSGVFHSMDNGENWIAANVGLPATLYVTALGINGNTIYLGSFFGLFQSTDNGASWTPINHGFSGPVYALITNGDKIYVGSNSGVSFSADNGSNWTSRNVVTTGEVIQALAIRDNFIFAGLNTETLSSETAGVFIKENTSQDWIPCGRSLPRSMTHSLAVDDDFVFAGTSVGLFRSSDDGLNWISLSLQNFTPTVLVDKNNVFTSSYGVYLSKDNGESWNAANDGLGKKLVLCLAKNDNTIFAGTSDGGIFSSSMAALLCKPLKPLIILTNGNVLTSSGPTAGNQWYRNGNPIPGATNQNYVATESGTYKVNVTLDGCASDFSNDQLVVVTGVEKTNLVNGLYPNPVTDKLTIHFGEDPARKVVMIYGINGQLLTSQQTSSKEVMLDVSEFPQGMYIVKVLTAVGSVKVIKFLKQ